MAGHLPLFSLWWGSWLGSGCNLHPTLLLDGSAATQIQAVLPDQKVPVFESAVERGPRRYFKVMCITMGGPTAISAEVHDSDFLPSHVGSG